MITVLAFVFLVIIFYLFIQFARQEHVQENYEDAIGDVEKRLEWAHTRPLFPFGMTAQLEISHKLLNKSKNLWENNKWHQAYRVSLQSQKAMNKAQSIYSSAIKGRH